MPRPLLVKRMPHSCAEPEPDPVPPPAHGRNTWVSRGVPPADRAAAATVPPRVPGACPHPCRRRARRCPATAASWGPCPPGGVRLSGSRWSGRGGVVALRQGCRRPLRVLWGGPYAGRQGCGPLRGLLGRDGRVPVGQVVVTGVDVCVEGVLSVGGVGSGGPSAVCRSAGPLSVGRRSVCRAGLFHSGRLSGSLCRSGRAVAAAAAVAVLALWSAARAAEVVLPGLSAVFRVLGQREERVLRAMDAGVFGCTACSTCAGR